MTASRAHVLNRRIQRTVWWCIRCSGCWGKRLHRYPRRSCLPGWPFQYTSRTYCTFTLSVILSRTILLNFLVEDRHARISSHKIGGESYIPKLERGTHTGAPLWTSQEHQSFGILWRRPRSCSLSHIRESSSRLAWIGYSNSVCSLLYRSYSIIGWREMSMRLRKWRW